MEGACINTYTTHSNKYICSHSALTCRWFMAFLWSGFAISDCDTHIKSACFCCWMPRKVVVWLELELQQRAWRILTYFDNISTASLIWIQSHFYSIFLFLLLWFFFRLYSLIHFICFFCVLDRPLQQCTLRMCFGCVSVPKRLSEGGSCLRMQCVFIHSVEVFRC